MRKAVGDTWLAASLAAITMRRLNEGEDQLKSMVELSLVERAVGGRLVASERGWQVGDPRRWATQSPSEAVEVLVTRGLLPEISLGDVWCPTANECESCGAPCDPVGPLGVCPCDAACGLCSDGKAATATSYEDVLSVASYGTRSIETAVGFAREIAAIAGCVNTDIVFSVLTSSRMKALMLFINERKRISVTQKSSEAILRVFATEVSKFDGQFPEDCYYTGVPELGGFGSPDDDKLGVHRTWRAVRGIAKQGIYLVGLDDRHLVLGFEQCFDLPESTSDS